MACHVNPISGPDWSKKKLRTGKSVSEVLILESVNPQYDGILFIDLRLQKNTSSEHVVYKNCFLFLFWHSKQFLYTTCSELVFFSYWTRNSMNNLLSYCGLTDARMSTSEKDLPVKSIPPRERIGLRFLLQNFFHTIVCGIAYLSNLSQLFYTLTLYTSSSQSHGALWNAFLQWLTTKAINERARYIFLGFFGLTRKF